ncbi:MAG: DNA adenine methylase, partial [Bacillota bacterium]|nr:DNA adenine methylase [Bacillota bacterium]
LLLISEKFKNVKIKSGDYHLMVDCIDKHTFVYIDPPYRPLTKTAAFTAYTQDEFGDDQQEELARFFAELASKGAKVLLSNSDPKNVDATDNFFDELYKDYNIQRVAAHRNINRNGAARGKINELLIANY